MLFSFSLFLYNISMRTIFIYLIYPIWTILFASQASILEENLSIAGNLPYRHPFFILWAIVTLSVLGSSFNQCIRYSIHKSFLKFVSIIASSIFLFAVILPYLPERYPMIADWHISLSFAGLITMLGCVGMMMISLTFTGYRLIEYNMMYVSICMISLMIFFGFGLVNSLVEIFAAISTAIYLDQLAKRLTVL